MSAPMLYFACPDVSEPAGGVKVIYRHVEILRRNGFRASVLHRRRGFRCGWFESAAPAASAETVRVRPEDILVFPETCVGDSSWEKVGAPSVIFNQNAYRTFDRSALGVRDDQSLYRRVRAAVVVSEDSRRYLRHAFPKLSVHRVRVGIDASVFGCSGRKKRQIAFMPRKLLEDAVQVLKILEARGALKGVRVVPIQHQDEREVARILRESLIFLSFSVQEGCPLPPLEAMACGCFVIGYPGRGGREYFRPAFCRTIADGDVLGFSQAVEEVLKSSGTGRAAVSRFARDASRYALSRYSLRAEESSVIRVWKRIAGDAAA